MTLSIDVYSDLHLDSWVHAGFNLQQIKFHPTKGANVCVFAGDAGNGIDWYLEAIKMLKSKYSKVIATMGNHDWYGSHVFREEFNLDFNVSNKLYTNINGYNIFTTPLWTNFRNSKVNREIAANSITDFSRIKEMTPAIMASLNAECVKELERISELSYVDIVVSHFPPIRNSEHPSYAGSSHLNPYFVNDMPELVENVKPKVWIHGHSHKPFNYKYKDTQIVANPIGYAFEEQNEPLFFPTNIKLHKKEVTVSKDLFIKE